MFKSVLLLSILFLAWSGRAKAQGTRSVAYVDLRNANDVYYKPLKTDRYFSNGLRLEVGTLARHSPRWRAYGSLWKRTYLRATQNIYTPAAIAATELVRGDRPFASVLHLSYGRALFDEATGLRFHRALTVGVMGQPAQGAWAQNWFHRMVPWADDVPGWRHEVKPDVVLNYQLALSQVFTSKERTQLELGGEARLGTLHTDLAATGLASWRVFGRRNRPLALTLQLHGRARAVGYDATLSGGLLNRDERYRGVIKPERLVVQGGFAGQLDLGHLRLTTGVHYLRPDFQGGLSHVWAYWSAGWWPTGARRSSRP